MKRMEQSEERLQRKNQFDGSLVFGTRVFNKRTRRDEYVDYSKRQVRDFFVDTQTGLLYEHMAHDNRDCPICGGKEFDTIFLKDGFRHVKCNCGFIFVNPTASDKYRDKFSSEICQTWTDVLLTPEQELIDTRKFRYGLEFIENHITAGGLVVDIGAGTGLFLKVVRDAGWRVSAVEPNQKAAEIIRNLDIEVFDKALRKGMYVPNSGMVQTI